MYDGMYMHASTHSGRRCYMQLSSQIFAPECYARETSPSYLLDSRLSGPQCWSEYDGEKENPSLFREFEAYHVTCSQLLYRLSYLRSIFCICFPNSFLHWSILLTARRFFRCFYSVRFRIDYDMCDWVAGCKFGPSQDLDWGKRRKTTH